MSNYSYKDFENRELSWLAFNERVLEEAETTKNPLLERFRFIAIFSSNLDEFFMIRVAGIADQLRAGYNNPEISGLTPKEQLEKILSRVDNLTQRQFQDWQFLKKQVSVKNLFFKKPSEVSKETQGRLKRMFERDIFPALTPMAIDPTHPFPFLYTQTLNLLCRLKSKENNAEQFAIIPVPSILPRYFKMNLNNETFFFFIEDLIGYFGEVLFPGYELLSSDCFRITRNADLTVDEDEAEDLLLEIEDKLKARKKGIPVRLEVEGSIQKKYLNKLKEFLEIPSDEYVFRFPGRLDLTFCMDLAGDLSEFFPDASYKPFKAIYKKDNNLFEHLKKEDIILHHPYESFQPVVDLLAQAAKDPNVLAIKQTLYRSSGKDSEIIKQLLKAVENNKQVTVLLELKARFDEEKNIEWAKILEEAGCHVVYGVKGLKTHAKALLIVRREETGEIKRYMHFGTGNYNEKTAKLYTDLSYMTSREDFAMDTASFFNYLTGYALEPRWQKLTTSPKRIRDKIIHLVDNEIKNHTPENPGRVVAKMNSLVDQKTIEKLYEASQAGVQVDLFIRGICCLRAGVKGLSENIRVRSIIGRFLEHSRIMYFKNAGDELFYISSADWMPRNFDRRVELMVPIESKHCKKAVWELLEYNLKDNQNSRELSDKIYHSVERAKDEESFCMHNRLSNTGL